MQPITAQDYKNKFFKTKMIELKSGAVFEIKKITTRDIILAGVIPIKNKNQINNAQEFEQVKNQMSNEDIAKQSQAMIIKAVINPKISLEEKEGFLHIDLLTDEDYKELCIEISNFSFGGEQGENLADFREKQDTVNT